MRDNIKLLEELVMRAADRLQGLTRERDELRKRVAALEARGGGQGNPEERDDRSRRTRTRVVAELRQALAELREERDAV